MCKRHVYTAYAMRTLQCYTLVRGGTSNTCTCTRRCRAQRQSSKLQVCGASPDANRSQRANHHRDRTANMRRRRSDCAAPTFLSCLKCSRPARTTVSVILTRAQAGPAVGQSPRPCHPSNAPRTCRPRVSRCARTRPLVPSPATALAPASIRALIWLPTPRIPQHPQHPQYPASCILFL